MWEIYCGQRRGEVVFYEHNESDADFRRAALDAIEITELKRELSRTKNQLEYERETAA
jgi:hypothetical protein